MPVEIAMERHFNIGRWFDDGFPISHNVALIGIVNTNDQRELLSECASPSKLGNVSYFYGSEFTMTLWKNTYGYRMYFAGSALGKKAGGQSGADSRWTAKNAIDIINTMSRYGAGLSYACAFEELFHRNQLATYVPWAKRPCTCPVGKDHKRYIPGLYWANYFSIAFMRDHGIGPESIAAELGGTCEIGTLGALVKLYESPDLWRAKMEAVDKYIQGNAKFFSIRNIPTAILKTPIDLTTYLHKVRAEWP